MSIVKDPEYSTYEEVVRAWNRRYPIGTPVLVQRDSGRAKASKTESEAWILGHTPVVLIKGIRGAYLLSRVSPVTTPAAPPTPEESLYLTAEEAAELLHLSRRVLCLYIRKGFIHATRIGRVWRVVRADLVPDGVEVVPGEPLYWPIEKAAKLLRISTWKMIELMQQQKYRGRLFGRIWRVLRADLRPPPAP